jgi:hypothetical protein
MAAPPALKANIQDIADHLWERAGELRANSYTDAAEYHIALLDPTSLKFAGSQPGSF